MRSSHSPGDSCLHHMLISFVLSLPLALSRGNRRRETDWQSGRGSIRCTASPLVDEHLTTRVKIQFVAVFHLAIHPLLLLSRPPSAVYPCLSDAKSSSHLFPFHTCSRTTIVNWVSQENTHIHIVMSVSILSEDENEREST